MKGDDLIVSIKGEKIKTGIKIVDEDGYFHDDLFLAGSLVEILVDRIAARLLTGREI